MRHIKTTEITDGMILAEAVYGNSGQIILNQGSSLTKSLAHRIEARGISQVAIEGEVEHPTKSSAHETNKISIDETLEKIFSKSMETPIMKSIYQQIHMYITSRKGM